MTMDREEKEKDRDRERQRDSRGREKERDKEREKVKLKEKEKDRDLEKKERGGKEPEKERAHDKEKDRERGKDKERDGKALEKEKDREKEKEKDRAKDQEREKDRAKDQEREKDRTKDQEREKDRTKDQEREKIRTKDQERDRKKEREKEKKREHSKKDEDREKEKEKEKKRERERGKDRERDDNDREKERERDGREKERERDGREKEREREVREKERERDKEWDKEREKENDREKGKDQQKSRGAREKERDNREKEHRDHDRVNNNNNRYKDWTERDRERETEKEHEAEKVEKQNKRDDKERASKEAHGSRPSASELEERITKMREERHKASAEQTSSAKKADADDDDIHNWVNKSRKIEHRKKLDDRQKAARMAKMFAEQDNEEDDDNSGDEFTNSGYGGKDLAGLKVRHGFDKVMEGHAIVLTLKDTSVLDGDDVNEAGDELENIEMAEQQARQDAYKAAKKKPGSYEDKFGNDMDALVTERKILPQYDDVVKDEGLILDANGGLSEESKKKLEEVRLRLEGASAKESLSGSIAKPVSDYYTEEDMLQFKKPKKKKKLRKRDKIDIDELEAEAVAAGLGDGDLGSRDSEGRRGQRLADEKAAADARKNAYQNALNKAEDASMALRKENAVEAMEVDKADSPVYVGEDDDDFYKSLDRARQAALQNQRNSGNVGSGPQSVVARLAALNQEAVSSSQIQAGAETQEGGLIFTDTGEFCRSLQLDDAITRRERPKDVFAEDEEEEPAEEMEIDTSKVEGGWTEVVDVDKKHPVGEEETDGGEPSEEPVGEVSVGKGLAGALSLLKERGTLKETTDWGGRNMDKKRSKLVGIIDESNNQVGQRDILLDRVDEFGRMMTPKEAFRKLSHKFHGKGPGKMKQEKKQKQFQEELRLKQMNSGDTPLMSMQKMREAQARMHTPYIVISGHIKPGQTSDPRSGFGTVEKEPIGSLTPMLGDKSAGSLTPMLGDKKPHQASRTGPRIGTGSFHKRTIIKVEHFLGIKRKPDSGFKEPPPKQPKFEH